MTHFKYTFIFPEVEWPFKIVYKWQQYFNSFPNFNLPSIHICTVVC